MKTKYCLEQDDSGHQYILPYNSRELFAKYLEENPEKIEEIKGIFRLEGEDFTFENPRINGDLINPPYKKYVAIISNQDLYTGFFHISICPKTFWEKNGHLPDDHAGIEIPGWFESSDHIYFPLDDKNKWSIEEAKKHFTNEENYAFNRTHFITINKVFYVCFGVLAQVGW